MKKWPIVLVAVVLLAAGAAYAGRGVIRDRLTLLVRQGGWAMGLGRKVLLRGCGSSCLVADRN